MTDSGAINDGWFIIYIFLKCCFFIIFIKFQTIPVEEKSAFTSSLPELITETFLRIENRLQREQSDCCNVNIVIIITKEKLNVNFTFVVTDDELRSLFGVFGDTLERALVIIDKLVIKIYKKPNNNRTIIEIPGSNNCVYRFFPNINYCTCEAYQYLVLKSRSQYTCKHILAAKIALLTNKNVEIEVLNDSNFNVIIEQITKAGFK